MEEYLISSSFRHRRLRTQEIELETKYLF